VDNVGRNGRAARLAGVLKAAREDLGTSVTSPVAHPLNRFAECGSGLAGCPEAREVKSDIELSSSMDSV